MGVLGDYIVAGRSPTELANRGGAPLHGEDAAPARSPSRARSPSGGPADGARGLWIGRPVAAKADIAVGDTLFLRAMNRHGVENLYDVPVAGIFEYGYPVLDKQMIYLDRATADELLDLDGGVTHLVIRLHAGARVDDSGGRARGRCDGCATRSAVGEAAPSARRRPP